MAYYDGHNYSSFRNVELRDGVLRFKGVLSSAMDSTNQSDTFGLYVRGTTPYFFDKTNEIDLTGQGNYNVTPTLLGAQLPANVRFVTVQNVSAATDIVKLPAATAGTEILLYNAATGYELRSYYGTTIAINSGSAADAECAIPADQLVRVVCLDGSRWVGYCVTNTGTLTDLQIAAA